MGGTMIDLIKYYKEIDDKFDSIIRKERNISAISELENRIFWFFNEVDLSYNAAVENHESLESFMNALYFHATILNYSLKYSHPEVSEEFNFESPVTLDHAYSSLVKKFDDALNNSLTEISLTEMMSNYASNVCEFAREGISQQLAAKISNYLMSNPQERVNLSKGLAFLRKIRTMISNDNEKVNLSWDDIVGNEDSKQSLKELSQKLFLYDITSQSNPYYEFGDLPKSVLLYGPPGTGKTSLVKATIHEMQYLSEKLKKPFRYYIIDNTIKSKYYSESVKKLDSVLKESSDPSMISLVVLEDIDLLFSSRESTMHEEEGKFLNHFMNYVDGIATHNRGNVAYISTTNNYRRLDSALLSRIAEERYLVEGPKSLPEYNKILKLKLDKLISKKLVNLDELEWIKLSKRFMNQHVSGRELSNFVKSLVDEVVKLPSVEHINGKSYQDVVSYLKNHTRNIDYAYLKQKFDNYFVTFNKNKETNLSWIDS